MSSIQMFYGAFLEVDDYENCIFGDLSYGENNISDDVEVNSISNEERTQVFVFHKASEGVEFCGDYNNQAWLMQGQQESSVVEWWDLELSSALRGAGYDTTWIKYGWFCLAYFD